jgi:hypothetical protein
MTTGNPMTEISDDDVEATLDASALAPWNDGLLALLPDLYSRHAAFMVLTTCRIWRFAVEQVHCPKAQAARWVLDRDASLLVVRQALRQYQADSAVVIDQHGIARLLDAVVHETSRTR